MHRVCEEALKAGRRMKESASEAGKLETDWQYDHVVIVEQRRSFLDGLFDVSGRRCHGNQATGRLAPALISKKLKHSIETKSIVVFTKRRKENCDP